MLCFVPGSPPPINCMVTSLSQGLAAVLNVSLLRLCQSCTNNCIGLWLEGITSGMKDAAPHVNGRVENAANGKCTKSEYQAYGLKYHASQEYQSVASSIHCIREISLLSTSFNWKTQRPMVQWQPMSSCLMDEGHPLPVQLQ